MLPRLMVSNFGVPAGDRRAMFEQDHSKGILTNGLIRNFHMANSAAKRAANSEVYADELEAYVKELEARVIALRQAAAANKLTLDRSSADVAGLEAINAAYKATHPNSPIRADSGKRYKDGDVKIVTRIHYERAFDQKMRSLGYADPASHRVD